MQKLFHKDGCCQEYCQQNTERQQKSQIMQGRQMNKNNINA